MFNLEEVYVSINSYLLKLKKVVEEQATFTWFKTRFVSKKRVDDLLCCIEGSFPEEYKKHIEKYGGSNMAGYKTYQKLTIAARRKALLSSDSYSVDYAQVLYLIKSFQSGIKSDLKKLCESDNNMF